MKAKFAISALLGGILCSGVALADSVNTCPVDYQAQADAEFGSNTSSILTCIKKRNDVKVVLNMSTAVLNPKKGISQTLNNAVLMIANYKNLYGISLGDGLQFDIVAHFQGGKFLLTDDAYNKAANVTTGNPSRAVVESLVAQGVHIYMCQNTMRGNSWVTSDLIPGVEEVPGGVLALVDFSARGWAVITP